MKIAYYSAVLVALRGYIIFSSASLSRAKRASQHDINGVFCIDVLVSIVTVSFNSEATIRETIEHVLDQTYESLEYIIIDGQSSDSTADIARSYSEAFAAKGIAYRVISEKDDGIYDAMNKGIRLANGDIVGIINSDDWYEPDAARRAADIYHEQKYDLFYADIMIHTKTRNIVKHAGNGRLVTTRKWNHPTTFIRREIYQKFQYRCRNIYDDWDLILRIRRAGCKVVVLGEVLAHFRFGGVSNERSFGKVRERIRMKYRIYRENGYSRFYWLDCVIMEVAKYFSA